MGNSSFYRFPEIELTLTRYATWGRLLIQVDAQLVRYIRRIYGENEAFATNDHGETCNAKYRPVRKLRRRSNMSPPPLLSQTQNLIGAINLGILESQLRNVIKEWEQSSPIKSGEETQINGDINTD